eukprot:TRINITY_DN27345_c0_g1_i1.p1 TRINITY_DN27345_c0_g1~~TRINITY_DN27345_c0_g1_i1.p1  ORF type:complete len:390 (+),score=55.33 TRINITY_DN27345_c0_g1_i1:175-1170(+)
MYTPLAGFVDGGYPVAIFFVLSGYVLSRRYTASDDFDDLVRQCHKRLPRLLPPCLVVIAAYIASTQSGLYTKLHGEPPEVDPLTALLEDGFVAELFNQHSCIVQLWTLGFELFAPHFLLVVASLSPKPRRGLGYERATMMVSFICLPLCSRFTYPLSCFAAGYYIAEEEEAHKRASGKDEAWLPAVVTFLASHVLMGLQDTLRKPKDALRSFHFHWPQLGISLAGGSLVWLVVASPALSNALTLTQMFRVAHLTFAVYVLHLLVLYLVRNVALEVTQNSEPAAFALFVAILVPVSALLHYTVETWGMSAGNRLSRWLMDRRHYSIQADGKN